MFERQKKSFLMKKDKSKKAGIDSNIKKLVDLINSKYNFYTTSSCSGRVVLIKRPERKKGAEWLFVKHDDVNFDEIKRSLDDIPKEQIWFRMEPLIMHICCKTLEDAKKLLVLARRIFKRAGIIAFGKKIIIEIIGTGFIYTIISERKLLVSDDHIKALIKEANKKMVKNRKDISKFYCLAKKYL